MSLILSGKERLGHRVAAGDGLFAIWKELEELLIDEFRAGLLDIPSFLKMCRKGLGMSKTEVATIIGISAKAYSNYENGQTKIGAKFFFAIWSTY